MEYFFCKVWSWCGKKYILSWEMFGSFELKSYQVNDLDRIPNFFGQIIDWEEHVHEQFVC